MQFLRFISLSLIFLSLSAQAEVKFWRTYYESSLVDEKTDKPLKGKVRADRIKFLEDAFGAKLYIMNDNIRQPEKPVKVDGVVFHDNVREKKYVIGDLNPQVESEKVISKLTKMFGLEDIDEKMDEYTFLNKYVPEIAPPEMHLASDYTKPQTDAEKTAANEKIKALKTKYANGTAEGSKLLEVIENNEKDFSRLFTVQDRINNAEGMGRSILKIRDANHSEGKLPITDKDWGDLYANYLNETKAKITENTSAEELVYMPFVAGRVLEYMLSNEPESVIVQHMIKIKREIRVHISGSRIVEGASFLRFYKLNEYLTKEEIKKVHDTLEEKLLKKMRADGIHHLSASPDMAILEDGSVKILDFNDGNYSGYLSPYEDLFTTNLFASHYSGDKTTVLKEFEYIKSLPLGKEKTEALRDFRAKYMEFFEGDVSQSFYDRLGSHLMDILAESPTPTRFEKVLTLMKKGGANTKIMEADLVYMQFIAEVQDRWPNLVLPKKAQEKWVKYFNKINPYTVTFTDESGHFLDTEIKDPKVGSCFALKRVSAQN